MQMGKEIITKVIGGVLVITISRPDVMSRLDPPAHQVSLEAGWWMIDRMSPVTA